MHNPLTHGILSVPSSTLTIVHIRCISSVRVDEAEKGGTPHKEGEWRDLCKLGRKAQLSSSATALGLVLGSCTGFFQYLFPRTGALLE